MDQENWISTKNRMPEEGDSVVVSLIYRGRRQYCVLEDVSTYIKDGKIYFGSNECDYWQPIVLIR